MPIAQTINAAKAANFAQQRSTMIPDYRESVEALLSQLGEKGIPFVIVGGIAVLQYVSGRNTEDIDLILASETLAEIRGIKVQDQNDMFARCEFHGLQVDILFSEHPLFRLVMDHFSVSRDYDSQSYATATIDGLILLKLYALPSLYRQMDWDRVSIYESDLMQLLRRTETSPSALLEQLSDHLSPSDHHELKTVLSEIEARLGKQQRFD
jgi:hypothetical protein